MKSPALPLKPVCGLLLLAILAVLTLTTDTGFPADIPAAYFPPPESKGGWRKLEAPQDIRKQAGMDPDKLTELRDWLLASDDRTFAAVVIHKGFLVLEVSRGNSPLTDTRNVKSCAKAICATVLAIASE